MRVVDRSGHEHVSPGHHTSPSPYNLPTNVVTVPPPRGGVWDKASVSPPLGGGTPLQFPPLGGGGGCTTKLYHSITV